MQSFAISTNRKDILVETSLRGGRGNWCKSEPGKRPVAGLAGQRPATNVDAPITAAIFKRGSLHCSQDGLIMSGKVAGPPYNKQLIPEATIQPDILTE